jgi:hypothetical protein
MIMMIQEAIDSVVVHKRTSCINEMSKSSAFNLVARQTCEDSVTVSLLLCIDDFLHPKNDPRRKTTFTTEHSNRTATEGHGCFFGTNGIKISIFAFFGRTKQYDTEYVR